MRRVACRVVKVGCRRASKSHIAIVVGITPAGRRVPGAVGEGRFGVEGLAIDGRSQHSAMCVKPVRCGAPDVDGDIPAGRIGVRRRTTCEKQYRGREWKGNCSGGHEHVIEHCQFERSPGRYVTGIPRTDFQTRPYWWLVHPEIPGLPGRCRPEPLELAFASR